MNGKCKLGACAKLGMLKTQIQVGWWGGACRTRALGREPNTPGAVRRRTTQYLHHAAGGCGKHARLTTHPLNARFTQAGAPSETEVDLTPRVDSGVTKRQFMQRQ